MSLTVRADRALIRAAGGSTRHVLAQITAAEAPSTIARPSVHVALVLDRSGSMGGEKILLARQAAEHALRLLSPKDHFSLVVFDNDVDVLVGSTPASGEARSHAMRELARIEARGSTNLEGGWAAGCEQVLTQLTGDGLGRCLLVTDGHANVGERAPEQLSRLAAAMRGRGVATSTFGIGADFDERTLQLMSEGGQGHFYYVAAPAAIPDLLTSELGDSLQIVARDAALVVQAPEGVDVALLGPYRVAAAERVVRVELGDLTSGQELELVIRLRFGSGAEGDDRRVRFSLVPAEASPGDAGNMPELTWTFAAHARNDGQPRDRVVDRSAGRTYADLARQEALALNRQGRYADAQRVIEQVAAEVAAYAGTDPELLALVRRLRHEAEAYGSAMDVVQAKQRHFRAYSAIHSRAESGIARRRGEQEAHPTTTSVVVLLVFRAER